jgi:type VI secretion system secreted protein VgrG
VAIVFELSCPALPAELSVVGARGSEAMNALPRWEISVLVPDATLDPEATVGAQATLRLVDALEGTSRSLGLVVTDVAYEHESRDGHHYLVALSPAEQSLTLRSGYKIFREKTPRDIVDQVLKDAGVPAAQVVWRLSGEYETRLHTTQYGETDWAFIERMLAEEGISYWFDFLDDQHPILVFGDDPASHEGMPGGTKLPFQDAGGLVGPRHLSRLEIEERLTTTAVQVRDYDVRAPDVYLDGKAGEGAFEHFEYPARVLTMRGAEQRAKVRLQQHERLKVVAHGVCDCVRVQPGRVVELGDCADPWMNGRWLILSVEHEGSMGSRADAAPKPYRSKLTMVPVGPAPHRPALPERPPRIEGVEPAFTTGPGGEEIHVDDLARVKIRFPWDRSGPKDDSSSYWVRCLQLGMGASMLLPRVGWEVPVAFMDGDPDRPFVLGRFYNGTAIVPYGLPGAAATTSLQSATSPGGGSTNEIRMGDSGGKQELFIHASKDQSVTVGGSADTTVSANETHDIGLTLKVGVHGSQSLSVGASQSVNVGTDYATQVAGSRTEMIGGMEAIKTTGNRLVSVKGAYTELIGGLYGVQCNQANTGVKGAFTQLIGGSLGLAAALGASESVAAARTELVGGSKSYLVGSGMGESVIGMLALTAGPTKETAGGGVDSTTKAAGNITVGGSANLTSGALFTLKAPTISITVAGNIKANGVKIGGGKVKAGKATFSGMVKRKAGSKIG